MDDQNPVGDRAEPDRGFSLDSGDSVAPDAGFALGSAAADGFGPTGSTVAHSIPEFRPLVIAPETAQRVAIGVAAEEDSAETASADDDIAEDADDVAAEGDPQERQSRELAYELARTLAGAAPDGWTRLDAVFALTATETVARVFYTDADRVVESIPTEAAVSVARAQRDSTVQLDDGPWWRMLLGLTADSDGAYYQFFLGGLTVPEPAVTAGSR